MTPAAVIVAVALIAGAGYCFGREVGFRQGRHRTLEQVRRLGHRRHPSERAAADLNGLLWAFVGAWSLALAVVYLGGFK